ncbi:oligosaccharide flippase family protein [Candidatus Roizmanbacteria bacterium]|nr:oligosaccharide flippase family protein [Candidatus Roizmanbacteria bacterium]
MLEKLLLFLKKPTSRDVLINTFGNYLNVFFTALFALILVRILTPPQYGVLSVLLGIAYVLSNVLDFGTTATIYSYLPPMMEKKTANLYRFIKSMFFYQSLFSLLIIAALFITFPYLDRVFFKTRAPIWELYLTSFSVLFLIWQNFVNNILFAAKKFFKANLYNNLANVLKTLIILFMVFTKTVGVGSIIFVFGIIGPIIFFFLLFLEKKDLIFILLKSEVRRDEFRFGYTLTYFIASQFFNLGLRMDLFLLSYYLSKAEVGYYGLAQKIILTVSTTIISITQVLSPRFSQIKYKHEVSRLLKIALGYMLFPTGIFVILYFVPTHVFDLFFTVKFVRTAAITRALSLPFIFYALGSVPMLFLLYTIKKPLYILISNIIFFVVLTFGSYLLIPTKGVFGPPVAIFAALFLATSFQVFAVIKECRKLPIKA